MKKTLTAIMICISSMTSVTAALAIQPALAYNYSGNGLTTDSTLSPGSSYNMTWTYEQLTLLSNKNLASAYVGDDIASHASDKKLNQSASGNLNLVNSSIQPGLNGKSPLSLTLQQMYGSTTLSGKQINLRGVYTPEPASVALVCAGLVALPFARRFRIMLQNA
jgi:hypothetical protein